MNCELKGQVHYFEHQAPFLSCLQCFRVPLTVYFMFAAVSVNIYVFLSFTKWQIKNDRSHISPSNLLGNASEHP